MTVCSYLCGSCMVQQVHLASITAFRMATTQENSTKSLSKALWDLDLPQDILHPLCDRWFQSPSLSKMRRVHINHPILGLKSLPSYSETYIIPSPHPYSGNSFRFTQCICLEQELANYGPLFVSVNKALFEHSHPSLFTFQLSVLNSNSHKAKITVACSFSQKQMNKTKQNGLSFEGLGPNRSGI